MADAATIGRPTDYRASHVKEAEKLAKLGATDNDIANFFEVDPATIWRWKKEHDAFCNALKRGKQLADDTVQDRLFKRATGYSHAAVKVFMPAGAEKPVYAPYIEHFPPDPTSMIFWLKNRRPDEWREKVELDGKMDMKIEIVRFSDGEKG